MTQTPDGNGKVVRLHQPKKPGQSSTAPASGVDNAVNPKSLLNMTELEQRTFLQQLRERRLKAARALAEANDARYRANTIGNRAKMERKIAQAMKQLDAVTKAIDKLEDLTLDVRAMQLQYTDVPLGGGS